jgi:hypothetical protein
MLSRLINTARQQAIDEITNQGFKLVGGVGSSRTAKFASDVVSRITDNQIAERVDLGNWASRIWAWLVDNKELILSIVKIILTIAMLFLSSLAVVGSSIVSYTGVAFTNDLAELETRLLGIPYVKAFP